MNTEKLLEGLNDGQREAVMHIKGPALTTATAGAGKTRVVITRTQYMIANGLDPSTILLTTFTNKAANEIKERVIDKIGEKGKQLTVGTYHSICYKILRQYANKLDFNKHFTIIDESDCDKILKEIGKKYSIDPDTLKLAISEYKTQYKTPQQAMQEVDTEKQKDIINGYQEYQDELKRQMVMDFDDLLFNCVKLFELFPEVLADINNRWQYISCDEVQDSSHLDSRLTYYLSGPNNNIFMVGDDYQAIYGFRGSDMSIMLNLKATYPNLKIYNLGINYRSTDTIVNIGKSIIKNNTQQMDKEVSCGRGVEGMKAVFTTVKSQQDQAKKIVAYIKTMKKKGVPYKEMAVLYRNNFLSRNIEKALMENQIKYKIYGGIPFFNRAEVQDVLSYLKLLVNPYDFQAFKRSVACPKRGIGEKALDTIENYCRDNNLNIRTAIAKDDIGLKPKAKKALKEYVEVIEHLENLSMQLEPHEMIQQVLLCTGYYTWFQEQYKNDNLQEREENLSELVSVAKEYINIDELITQAALYKEELEEEEDAVQLLTMHKSKGLEFKCVFIIDLAEGCMPSFRATSVQDIEEERRLMFVAVTRAKDYLFMMYPQNQQIGGQNKYVQISRFIKEIDSDLLTRF